VNPIYSTSATASGDGRNGHTRSDDGLLEVDVRIPVAMGGPGGATNPEQLFAAGYAACFHSALKMLARQQKLDVDGSEVTVHVSLGPDEKGGYRLAVGIDLHAPALDEDAAHALLEQAHQVCPYSNATRGNVEVELTVA
jgi:Ohr subfamily peroxiredoxin